MFAEILTHSCMEQITLQMILRAVVDVSGVTFAELSGSGRSLKIDRARGAYYVIADEVGYKAKDMCKEIVKSRSGCTTVLKHYKGYMETNDAELFKLVQKIKHKIIFPNGRK